MYLHVPAMIASYRLVLPHKYLHNRASPFLCVSEILTLFCKSAYTVQQVICRGVQIGVPELDKDVDDEIVNFDITSTKKYFTDDAWVLVHQRCKFKSLTHKFKC